MITGPQELGLRTLGRVSSADQFADVMLGTRAGVPIRIRDVARWKMARPNFAPGRLCSAARTRAKTWSQSRSCASRAPTPSRLPTTFGPWSSELNSQLPPGVQLLIVHDISDFIKASVHSLLEHLILGSILASAVVWIFIRNWRAVLIAAVAIPASIISTFTLMKGMDFSLNNMTLLALTLAVGIVIDDAIIVLENIFRFMEEKGPRPFRCSHRGDARDRPGGDGDHLLADHHLSAHRLHDRLRAEIRELLWLDDGDGHPGLAAGGIHAHADDEFPPAETGAGARRKSHAHGFLHRVETWYLQMLQWSLAHRASSW